MIAWVVGASGAWGRAVAVELIRRGFDVVALGRHDVPDLASWARARKRSWEFRQFDLMDENPPNVDAPPDALFLCAALAEGDRQALIRGDYLGPAVLVERVTAGMLQRGRGRIGVFVGQNARLGLRGLGDFSAAQAALWTWCEALQDELSVTSGKVTLTRVIPARTASHTQRRLAELSGRRARLRAPRAAPLVDAVLAGRRSAGRRPLAAAIAMVVR
jgi:short-subunit dehydrogenase